MAGTSSCPARTKTGLEAPEIPQRGEPEQLHALCPEPGEETAEGREERPFLDGERGASDLRRDHKFLEWS